MKSARSLTKRLIDQEKLANLAFNSSQSVFELLDSFHSVDLSAEMSGETVEDPILYDPYNPDTDETYSVADLNVIFDLAKKAEAKNAKICSERHPDLESQVEAEVTSFK